MYTFFILTSFYARKPDWTQPEAQEKFCTTLNEFVSKIEDFKWENYDMIFFPIWVHDHFYIMCFNLKIQMLDVIDNALVTEEMVKHKYGGAPAILKNFFRNYLGNGVNPTMESIVKTLKIRHMTLPWQNDTNKVDCGVYVMRHMETYMGGPVRNWNSGLAKNGTEAFIKLRAKYTEALFVGETNKKPFQTFSMIQQKFQKIKKKGKSMLKRCLENLNPVKMGSSCNSNL
ncbi:uncharacterized protein LOC121750944 [Salvia splendens]|uniref:uncharacterized protein LOC121750944 n=1 Tax=Salvia splendens TaxID=180675 RepID=UPI001C254128|nr:uncharacterized protein LOC121750944 [Salvia splendens]